MPFQDFRYPLRIAHKRIRRRNGAHMNLIGLACPLEMGQQISQQVSFNRVMGWHLWHLPPSVIEACGIHIAIDKTVTHDYVT